MSSKTRLLAQQRQWALSRGIRVDSRGYVSSNGENLLQPMAPRTEIAFKGGGGSELMGRDGAPPKIRALHSSAALAVNVFDYWSQRNLDPVGTALGLPGRAAKLEFEKQFPTGLGGTPPNLDVAITLDTGFVTGIECKFSEWLTPRAPGKQLFKAKYFPESGERWTDVALPRCQALAADLRDGKASFRYLDAAQLLKHVLGMATSHPGRFNLYYLHFDVPGIESEVHAGEVAQFEERVGSEVGFKQATYQEVHRRFAEVAGPDHRTYLEYLRGRYFDAVF